MSKGTSQLRKRRLEIWNDQGRRCCWCRLPIHRDATTIEHLIPRARGGGSSWANLAVSCFPCNHRRGRRLPTHHERFGVRRVNELLTEARDRAAAHAQPVSMTKNKRCRAAGCRANVVHGPSGKRVIEGIHVRLCGEHYRSVRTLADLKPVEPPKTERAA